MMPGRAGLAGNGYSLVKRPNTVSGSEKLTHRVHTRYPVTVCSTYQWNNHSLCAVRLVTKYLVGAVLANIKLKEHYCHTLIVTQLDWCHQDNNQPRLLGLIMKFR